MKTYQKGLLVIIGLIVATSAALAFIGPHPLAVGVAHNTQPNGVQAGDGVVSIQADMVQDKILKGSDGQVAVAVTLTAAQLPSDFGHSKQVPQQQIDMIVVLDRSGSMQGEKIASARQAVHQLINRLTSNDRLGLVTYSNGVQLVSPLVSMNKAGQEKLHAAVNKIYADGGTNLGGGLRQAIDLFVRSQAAGHLRKVILISDGLANQGITDPKALGRMAAMATDHQFGVSTVGVGLDFNELLMTTIADHGTGSYYFLEDPLVFAQVFEKEFKDARQMAATGLELRVPLKEGIRLVDAGGYPITIQDGIAIVTPGSLVSGQQRKLFLTFQIPTKVEQDISLGALQARYLRNGTPNFLSSKTELRIACVKDEKEVAASVDKETWSQQVLLDEYNHLKEEVANAIRKGDSAAAQGYIESYEKRNITKNEVVGSTAVADHLEKDVQVLRQSVADTFVGAPAVVMEKQKKQAKTLQYEGYRGRRAKK